MATRPAPPSLLRPLALLAAFALVLAGCGGTANGSPVSVQTTVLGNPADTPAPATAVPPSAAPATTSSSAPAGTAASPAASAPAASIPAAFEITEFTVPDGSHPHDVAPAADGGVWYTGQHKGVLGHLDPATKQIREIPLGAGSAPHGVIVGPDGAPWITDGGLNAIVRVDPTTFDVTAYQLPASRPDVNLNTAVFDHNGVIWFTGQGGIYGSLEPATKQMRIFDAPEGRGPYGITVTPDGTVWFCSLAGSYIARIDAATGAATVVEPPTAGQGARRVWSDSSGRIWVSEWNSGQVSSFEPASSRWQTWKVPGDNPQIYAVFVDDQDIVWLTDFGANAIVRFDPLAGAFTRLTLPSADAAVRQLLGRPGEIWGAESGTDKLVLIRAKG